MAKLAASTYGEALFELAKESGNADGMLLEAQTVKAAFTDNPELSQILNHPKIGKNKKIAAMEEIFSQAVSKDMMGFICLAVQKDRQDDIPAILDYVIAKIKDYKRIGIVKVKTPMELTPEQKTKVENKILATSDYKTLEVEYETDESLIGGMVIRIGDRIVDSSIKRKLSDLSRQLLNIQLNM